MNKKILTSLILIGVVSLSSGIGTYAAFSANVTSSGNTVKVGTFKINGISGENNAAAPIFYETDTSKIKPGYESTTPGVFTAINTGSLPMKMTADLPLLASMPNILDDSKRMDQSLITADDYRCFQIKPTITRQYVQDGKIETSTKQLDWQPISSFDKGKFINEYLLDGTNRLDSIVFKQNEGFIISFLIKLDGNADNNYQDASVSGELSVTGILDTASVQ